MAWFAIGAAVLVYFSTRPALSSNQLQITSTGLSVEVDARRGTRASQQPLEYDFDFDDDGKPEVTGTASTARHTFARPGRYKVHVTVRNPAWGTKASESKWVEVP
jgi:PKD repeat protein